MTISVIVYGYRSIRNLLGAIHRRARKSVRINAPIAKSAIRIPLVGTNGVVMTKNTIVEISKPISR